MASSAHFVDTFQQDNDPKHTSRAKRDYMNWMGLNHEPWLSQNESPDLNPIENLALVLLGLDPPKLRNRKCGNLDELWQALQKAWESLPVECFAYQSC